MKLRLVDKIFAWSPYQSISGLKAVSFEEYCLKEAFGDEARLPESLLLESFLQLGNWLLLLSSDYNQIGMVSRRCAFTLFFRPASNCGWRLPWRAGMKTDLSCPARAA